MTSRVSFPDRVPHCTCRNVPGYASLLDPHNVFVCGACGKPSEMVYRAHIKTCLECPNIFSSPWEDLCQECTDLDIWYGWPEMLEEARQLPFGTFSSRYQS